MSSQKTEHYELNQWLATDQVLRTDFNTDNAKVEAALDALAGQVAEKADTSLFTTLSGTVNTLSATRNARVYISSYTGNGAASRTFSFPARPMLVNIMGSNNWLCAVQGASVGSGGYLGGGGEAINVTWSGHSMTVSSPSGDASYLCNWSGDRYSVVALLDANA